MRIKNGTSFSAVRKDFGTKRVWFNGKIMKTYIYCPPPDQLQFRSEMINDFNQNLCCGWGNGIKNENEVIVDRVVNKLKPLGSISQWLHNNKNAAIELDQIAEKCQNVNLCVQRFQWKNPNISECLDLCQSGTFRELFDMDALAADYQKFLPRYPDMWEEIKDFPRDTQLSDYLGDKWDNLDWITGLILGYPIENTISILMTNGKSY